MAEGSDLLSAVDANLRDFGMRVSKDIELPVGPVAALFGSRTYFSWKGFVILSQHVAVCDYAFRQAKKVNRVPLLRGMQFGFMVIPCLVVASADAALVDYPESRPRKHWSLFEFPVVVDRGTGRTHYYDQTAMWGAFFFSDMRELVRRCIVPAANPVEAGATDDPGCHSGSPSRLER
jgi:hypothetical protein